MDPAVYKAAINGGDINTDSTNVVQAVTRGHENTILHVATIGGNEESVQKILKSNPELLKERNRRGETALHIAARLGHLEVANLLVKAVQADSNDFLAMKSTCEGENTALHEAVRNGHYDIVKLLLEANPSLANVTNGVGESPLFVAVDREFYDIARHILEGYEYRGDHSFISGRNGMNVMHAAVIRLHGKIPQGAELKFEEGVRVDSTEEVVSTEEGKIPQGTELEFEEGVRVDSTEEDVSIEEGKIPQDSELEIEEGVRVDSIEEVVSTEEEFVKKVLEKCGHEILEVQDASGWLPLHYVAQGGNEKVLRLFLESKNSLAYETDKKGMSALHIAIENGRNNIASILIEMYPDVCELKDKKGRTALHVAVEAESINVVVNLLNRKSFNDHINEKDEQGNTAMHLAAMHGHFRILGSLAKDTRVDKAAINDDMMTVVDIIQSSKKLSNEEKDKLLTKLKRRGFQPSLERRVQETDNVDKTEEDKISNEETDQRPSKEENKSTEQLKKRVKTSANVNLLVATIVASVTFAAAMSMPGGYDDTDGMAILRTKRSFKAFIFCNSLAFGSATATMFIHFLLPLMDSIFSIKTQFYLTASMIYFFIWCTLFAFMAGTNAVLNHDHDLTLALPAAVAAISFVVPILTFTISFVVPILT